MNGVTKTGITFETLGEGDLFAVNANIPSAQAILFVDTVLSTVGTLLSDIVGHEEDATDKTHAARFLLEAARAVYHSLGGMSTNDTTAAQTANWGIPGLPDLLIDSFDNNTGGDISATGKRPMCGERPFPIRRRSRATLPADSPSFARLRQHFGCDGIECESRCLTVSV